MLIQSPSSVSSTWTFNRTPRLRNSFDLPWHQAVSYYPPHLNLIPSSVRFCHCGKLQQPARKLLKTKETFLGNFVDAPASPNMVLSFDTDGLCKAWDRRWNPFRGCHRAISSTIYLFHGLQCAQGIPHFPLQTIHQISPSAFDNTTVEWWHSRAPAGRRDDGWSI